MVDQAELVFGGYRGQDDPAAGAAFYVQACGFYSRRSRGQPRNLCVATRRRCNADRNGRKRSKQQDRLTKRASSFWRLPRGLILRDLISIKQATTQRKENT